MKRLRSPDIALGLSGLVLLVSLFLPWYSFGPISVNAWDTFSLLDVYLAVTAFGALLAVGLTLLTTTPAPPLSATAITTTLGLFAAIWTGLELLGSEPDAAAFLALAASACMFGCGIWAMRDETLPGHPPQPEPELLDTPAP